jgi:SAM-dependent methyltransferase
MLDIEATSFDTVIATDVLEHLHTPKALFSLTSHVLRPSGKMIVGVPFLYWIHEEPNDFHRYTRFALEKMTRDAALEVVSVTPYGGAPEVLSDIAVKALGSRPRICRLVYAATRSTLRLSAIKKLSMLTSATMPMGYILVARKPVVPTL